ncbi:MAG TPA: enoyl-CoA hydratase-related protein [Chitinophagaceae bacterium]|nr:enoyl-CoA hydratase-related protein [Chitinophagaceae bacterium]
MSYLSLPTVLTELENGILIITINRPDKMNALNKDVITDLGKALEAVYTQEEIKGAIITGAGDKAFVAGADISEFEGLDDNQGASLAQRGADLVFNKIENAPKPIIAAVNGFALGGGCELAMACHFRTASENAQFGQPEVNLGLIPGYGGTQRLVQLIGKGRAMELLISAKMIKAKQAEAWGLTNYVFSSQDLLKETKSILENILSKAPIAIKHIISLVNEAATVSSKGFEDEIEKFGACFETEDKKEGTKAFMEKRKANFIGK